MICLGQLVGSHRAERDEYISAIVALTCLLSIVARASLVAADDWPHWRGPNRTGVVAEASGWNGDRWVNKEPAWAADIGEGASSPLVVGDLIYTLGHRDGRDIVTCLDTESGKTLWTTNYAARGYGRNATGDEGLYSGPSSTPEFDLQTRYLYSLGADGDLICWNAAKEGALVWRRNLYDDYQMPQRAKVGRSGRRDYGYTSAPLIHRDWLIVEAGGPKGTIVALDKRSGKEAWRSQANSVAGHTGGMAPLVVEGVACLAVMTFDGLLVVRLDEQRAGETVATYPWITDFANNIAGVAAHGDAVLITSSYNHEAICKLRISLAGAEKLWQQPFSSKACTPVIHKGRIYIAWNRLRALDWETGEQLWEGPPVGDAGSCIVTSDDKLIVWAKQGELILADAAPSLQEYRELARLERLADSDVWPHVALSDGRLFCRDRMGKLLCFEVSR
jgi:outer membrane protein assembly factor BamB